MKATVITICGIGAMIAAATIIAKPWVTIQHSKPIVVKGYAEQEITSDTGSLSARVVGTGATNAEAYIQAGKYLDKVNLLIKHALPENTEIDEMETRISEVLAFDEKGNRTNQVEYYRAVREIRVNSNDVHALDRLSRQLYDLNAEGISITVVGPEYFVSNLDEIKLDLVEQATKNGKERAEIMAGSSDQSLGSLVSAQQGVIQITKKNSGETTSWGVYDTETIDKVVKLVVTLEFEIE